MKRDFISPWHTLALFVGIGLLIFLGILFNFDGIKIGNYQLLYPTEEDLSAGSSRNVNMDRLLQDYHEIDVRGKRAKELLLIDSTEISKSKKKQEQEIEPYIPPPRDLQWSKNRPHPLKRFFTSLANGEQRQKVIRVLHYGDSQIEGDRITAKVREEMQQKFGGYGPGLQSFTPLVTSYSIRSEVSPHWKRYPGFGKKDSTITHNEYGPLINLSRYEQNDTSELPFIDIGPSKVGYNRIRHFDRLKIYFGKVRDTVTITTHTEDSVFKITHIHPGSKSPKTLKLPQPLAPIRLTFDGKSPDWYGYSAQVGSGIIVDNIPLRGASGTFFGAIPSAHFTSHFAPEEVRLIILQFGGNVVPYIDSEERAKSYGKRIEREIGIFQKRFPNADFIFVGPSDMATKVRTRMETFPHLVHVRDALKKAAFAKGIAFWDIFESMGGLNSMSSWVENEPPLASTDYVHFTPKGASVIAQWLTDAINECYEKWKTQKQTDAKK